MVVHQINSGSLFDSNIYLLTGSRNILIDTGTGTNNGLIIKGIKDVLKGKDLDIIILTHFHYDHIGGLRELMKEFGSEAMTGAGDAPYITSGDQKYTLSGIFDGELGEAEVTELMENDVIDIGEHRLRVINTPGHTCGGICLYDEVTHSLFSGDTVFANGVGRTDFPSGSSKELLASLRKLTDLDVKMLYPGHSDCTSDGNRAIKYGFLMMGGY